MEAIILMVNMKPMAFFPKMGMRVFLCLDGIAEGTNFLLDISREAVECRLGLVEERHIRVVDA